MRDTRSAQVQGRADWGRADWRSSWDSEACGASLTPALSRREREKEASRAGQPLARIRPGHGWCDDPADRRYNTLVPLPCRSSHEEMWRADHLYDVVIDIDWNRGPAVRGRGSAIFLHLARPGFEPTAGCVAVETRMIRRLLERIGPETRIEIVA